MSVTSKRPVVGIVGLILLLILTASMSASAFAAGNGKRWTAPLSSSEEVPPVDSQGTGVATFKLSKDGQSLEYKLNVANIEDVTQAHIHMGPAGTNGPVVAFLFGFVSGGVDVNGTLATGTITGDDLIGPLEGENFEKLVKALNAGIVYVNVHTVAHPPGEIRGQIK